jgi:small nuclear ribonucleoprotein (snRNP)-like protein
MAREGGGNILPLSKTDVELLEKCDGQQVWILLQDNREFSGQLRGHDENFNMILDNAKEL